ncbi:MAG TPA: polymer-forming cytoskeletal protein [Candidatus Binatia bacterium]
MAVWNQPAQERQEETPRVEPPTAAHATLAPVPAPVVKEIAPKAHRESIFGPGVSIEGTIEGDADLRIAGKFKGDIQISGDLSIEKGAHIAAKINAAIVTIAGELEGNIVASSQVRLLESGQLTGDLKAPTLTVAAGSRMRGHVEFGWNASEAAKFVNLRTQERDKTTG